MFTCSYDGESSEKNAVASWASFLKGKLGKAEHTLYLLGIHKSTVNLR